MCRTISWFSHGCIITPHTCWKYWILNTFVLNLLTRRLQKVSATCQERVCQRTHNKTTTCHIDMFICTFLGCGMGVVLPRDWWTSPAVSPCFHDFLCQATHLLAESNRLLSSSSYLSAKQCMSISKDVELFLYSCLSSSLFPSVSSSSRMSCLFMFPTAL